MHILLELEWIGGITYVLHFGVPWYTGLGSYQFVLCMFEDSKSGIRIRKVVLMQIKRPHTRSCRVIVGRKVVLMQIKRPHPGKLLPKDI